jgi:hypothetical protein
MGSLRTPIVCPVLHLCLAPSGCLFPGYNPRLKQISKRSPLDSGYDLGSLGKTAADLGLSAYYGISA